MPHSNSKLHLSKGVLKGWSDWWQQVAVIPNRE